MPAPVSVTDNFDALFTTTLRNASKVIGDTISTSNLAFYRIKESGGFEEVDSLGYQAVQPLMYELGTAQPYAGYDVLSTTPMEGLTAALWEWRNLAVPVTISGDEEAKNSGENALLGLLKAKIEQANLGIREAFNRYFLQGNGPNIATDVYTPYTSSGGAQFIDPLPLLVKGDPTTSTSIGSINQSTYYWWRNQALDADEANYAAYLSELRRLFNNCSKGPGGEPDIHIAGQGAFEVYVAALAASHQNASYVKGDIPFTSVQFMGHPLVFDQYVIDAENGTIAGIPVAQQDSWYMLNSKFIKIKVHSGTNFKTTEFRKPVDQDARSAQIMWRGAVTLSNRRKHGVAYGIDSTLTS
jgi:hypothetical protein